MAAMETSTKMIMSFSSFMIEWTWVRPSQQMMWTHAAHWDGLPAPRLSGKVSSVSSSDSCVLSSASVRLVRLLKALY